MNFAHPEMLWLAAVTVPLLSAFFWWAWRRKRLLIARFVQSRLLAQLTVGVSAARQKIRLALVVFAVGCVLVALARPQWGFDWEEARQRGLDIVVAIDTSRSMLAEDVRPNRLARARLAALDLMKLARGDRLALVPFAGSAFLQCPLTLDDEAFRQNVNALEVNIIPVGGTDLSEAMNTTFEAFKEGGDNFKILVLFTDGEDHDSGVREATARAARVGLRIFTIGVGTPNGELLRVTDANGTSSYVKDDQGNPVKSRLNETLLREIATATGGFYLPLRAANVMETLYREGLAPLPKSEISSRLFRRYHEHFQWPLALAIVALLAEMFLPERKRVPSDEPGVTAGHAQLPTATALLILLAVVQSANASPNSALRQYESGEFLEARKEFERLLEKNPGDTRLHYNAGAAAYRARTYDEASKQFTEALTSSDLPLQQRAYYNLGSTLYRLGEKTDDVQRKIEQWENSAKHFEWALNLDTQDADARHNLEFVKKKIEELKQQQDSQQQSEEQPRDQPENEPNEDQQKPSPEDTQTPQQQPEQDQEQGADKPPDPQEQQQQNQPQGGEGNEEPGDPADAGSAPPPGQMTLEQAQQLLDALKDEERAMIFLPQGEQQPGNAPRVLKDW